MKSLAVILAIFLAPLAAIAQEHTTNYLGLVTSGSKLVLSGNKTILAWEVEPTELEFVVSEGGVVGFEFDYPTNLWIYWGDDNVTKIAAGGEDEEAVHTYADAGTYTVSIWGSAQKMVFSTGESLLHEILTPIRGIARISSMQATFRDTSNCTNQPPDDLFDDVIEDVTSYRNCFRSSGIPRVVPMDGNSPATSVQHMYAYSDVKSWPPRWLHAFTNLNNAESTFVTTDCTNDLTSDYFSESHGSITTVDSHFNNVPGGGPIPGDFLQHLTNCTDFARLLNLNNRTGTVSSALLVNAVKGRVFESMLQGNADLEGEFPTNFLRNCPDADNISYLFSGTGLSGKPPPDSYWYNPNLTDAAAVYRNTGLTHIPETHWASNSLLDNLQGCYSGTPATNPLTVGLLQNNHLMENLRDFINGCDEIPYIEHGALDPCTNVLNYRGFAKGTTGLEYGLFSVPGSCTDALDMWEASGATGDVAKIVLGDEDLTRWGCEDSGLSYTCTGGSLSSNRGDGFELDFSGCDLPTGQVDNILVDLDTCGSSNMVITLDGDNQAPSGTGLIALTNLVDKGCTVTVTP
jgi:hypothetical protein